MQNTAAKPIVIAIVAFLLGGVGSLGVHKLVSHGATIHAGEAELTDSKLALYQNMRKLWADHVFWTREYVVGAIDNTADVQFAATRLMKNQEDIGDAIVPFYGREAGNQLATLLKEHITIAVDLIAAAKTNDQAGFQNANERWATNANDIAAFLSSANPHWPKAAMEEAMSMHLQTTIDEAVARLTKDYEKDAIAFDAVFDHMMHMSDVLAAGIIKQFPEKF